MLRALILSVALAALVAASPSTDLHSLVGRQLGPEIDVPEECVERCDASVKVLNECASSSVSVNCMCQPGIKSQIMDCYECFVTSDFDFEQFGRDEEQVRQDYEIGCAGVDVTQPSATTSSTSNSIPSTTPASTSNSAATATTSSVPSSETPTSESSNTETNVATSTHPFFLMGILTGAVAVCGTLAL